MSQPRSWNAMAIIKSSPSWRLALTVEGRVSPSLVSRLAKPTGHSDRQFSDSPSGTERTDLEAPEQLAVLGGLKDRRFRPDR